MQKGAKDKMIRNTDVKDKSEEAMLQEFHFSGGLEYQPLTIRAKSREEAEQIWLGERKKVEQI